MWKRHGHLSEAVWRVLWKAITEQPLPPPPVREPVDLERCDAELDQAVAAVDRFGDMVEAGAFEDPTDSANGARIRERRLPHKQRVEQAQERLNRIAARFFADQSRAAGVEELQQALREIPPEKLEDQPMRRAILRRHVEKIVISLETGAFWIHTRIDFDGLRVLAGELSGHGAGNAEI